MKKIYSLFTLFVFLILPFKVFADVDVTIKDTSTSTVKSVSVSIDSKTDTLQKIVLPVKYSSGVEITEITEGSIVCETFDYSESDDTVKITCEMEEPIAVSGILANIKFTSSDNEYTFTVLESSDLDLGELELGEIVDIQVTDEETESETTTEEEDTPLLVAQEDPVDTSTPESSMDKLTEYLPYILIAGSVVLLISIIGILLSKKKGTPKVESFTQETPPVQPTQEPTLKDIVNEPEVSTPPVEDSMTQSVTTPLPTESVPIEQPPVTPEVPTSEPIVPPTAPIETSQDQDMQDLLKSESTEMPQAPTSPSAGIPFTSNLNVNADTAITPPVTPLPTETTPPESVMPEMGTPQTTPDALQNSVNNEIQNMATTPPVQESTPPATDEGLPPVPPTM